MGKHLKLWVSIAVLAAASGNAAAEWASIGDQGQAEVFVDRATIVRKGDTATLWSVNALKSPGTAGGKTYVSLKRQDEFDCKNSLTRGVQISAHPQPLGEGEVIVSEKGSGKWVPISPGSPSETLWQIACGKE